MDSVDGEKAVHSYENPGSDKHCLNTEHEREQPSPNIISAEQISCSQRSNRTHAETTSNGVSHEDYEFRRCEHELTMATGKRYTQGKKQPKASVSTWNN